MGVKVSGIVGFAAGACIGAAIALLYAPRAGKHTRARLRNSAVRAGHRVEEVRDEVRAHMSEWVDETSELIVANIAAGKEKAIEGRERVLQVLEKARERMDEGKERIEAFIRSSAGEDTLAK
jgi:gas vesicle protein